MSDNKAQEAAPEVTPEMDEAEKKRRELKEQSYTTYTSIMNDLMERGYYSGAENSLTTFLALAMATEVTKRNLMKKGIPSQKIEMARRTAIMEIWTILDLYDKGKLNDMPLPDEKK